MRTDCDDMVAERLLGKAGIRTLLGEDGGDALRYRFGDPKPDVMIVNDVAETRRTSEGSSGSAWVSRASSPCARNRSPVPLPT
jgi:hypothetical protein